MTRRPTSWRREDPSGISRDSLETLWLGRPVGDLQGLLSRQCLSFLSSKFRFASFAVDLSRRSRGDRMGRVSVRRSTEVKVCRRVERQRSDRNVVSRSLLTNPFWLLPLSTDFPTMGKKKTTPPPTLPSTLSMILLCTFLGRPCDCYDKELDCRLCAHSKWNF